MSTTDAVDRDAAGPSGRRTGDGSKAVRLERWFMRRLPRRRRGKLLVVVVLLVATAGVLGVGMSIANLECGDTAAMVRLEVAGTSDRAAVALTDPADESSSCTTGAVRDALWGDVPFIIGYVVLLGLASVAFGSTGYRVGKFRRLAVPMAAAAVAAGVLDLGENISLWFGVDRDATEIGDRSDWPFRIAATFAWAKWSVVIVAVAYVVIAFVGYLLMPAWILKLRSDRAVEPSSAPDLPAIGEKPPARAASAADDLPPVDRPSASTPAEPETATPDTATPDTATPDTGDVAPVRLGIALSGGGVRSATFALGGMQALDHSDRSWDHATQIASVSGGGYMSGAWSLTRGAPGRPDRDGPGEIEPWADPGEEARRSGRVSPEEKYLRQHLGYLLEAEHNRPGGIPTLVVGLVVNVFALLLLVFLLARPFGWLIVELVDPDVRRAYDLDDDVLSITDAQWFPGLALLVTGVLFVLLWVCFSRFVRWRSDEYDRGWSGALHVGLKWAGRFGIVLGSILVLVLVVAPALMVILPQELLGALGGDPGPVVTAVSTVAGLGVFASVSRLVVDQASKWATKLGGVLLALIVVVLGGWWATDAAVEGVGDTVVEWAVWLGVALVALYAVSPEWWAMAPFYRGRLRRAYAITTDADGATTSYSSQAEPLLQDLAAGPGPLARYCCALNLKDDRVKTLSGIPALSFTMSAESIAVHHVDGITGAATEWSCTPRQLSALMKAEAPRVTPMLAVATSGAAVSSAMGRLGRGSTNSLLAFANVRLGVWLPHPRWAGQSGTGRTAYPRVRMSYLLKEVFGLFDWDDLHVYVTDGAHWEGTAIVELFRNSDVDEAIAFDAGGAGAASLVSPSEVITLSALELFDDVDIDVEPLRAKDDETRGGGLAERVATLGVVRGIDRNGSATIGLLWYARNVLAKETSARLLAYGERFTTFPSVSTLNQFFDDERFQSYRLLGYEAGRAILTAREALKSRVTACVTRRAFEQQLQPNDHWSIRELHRMLRSDAEYESIRSTLMGAAQPARSRAG